MMKTQIYGFPFSTLRPWNANHWKLCESLKFCTCGPLMKWVWHGWYTPTYANAYRWTNSWSVCNMTFRPMCALFLSRGWHQEIIPWKRANFSWAQIPASPSVWKKQTGKKNTHALARLQHRQGSVQGHMRQMMQNGVQKHWDRVSHGRVSYWVRGEKKPRGPKTSTIWKLITTY